MHHLAFDWTTGTIDALTTLGYYHLIVFALVVPFLAIRSHSKLAKAAAARIDRLKHFQSTAIMLVLFGALSVLTARDLHITLFPADLMPTLVALPAGVAMYVVAVTLMRPRWRKAVLKRARIVHLFMPQSAAERRWWLAVSVLAGVSEEITWRGVQTVLLAAIVAPPFVAMLICAVLFGVAHFVQGWKSAAVISLFAVGFHALVWLTGSLYLAMLVHVAYDVTAGLTYGRLGRKLGYDRPQATGDGLQGIGDRLRTTDDRKGD